jgi:hypothetical protein
VENNGIVSCERLLLFVVDCSKVQKWYYEREIMCMDCEKRMRERGETGGF